MIDAIHKMHHYTKLNPRIEFRPEMSTGPMKRVADNALMKKRLTHGYCLDSGDGPDVASLFQLLIAAASGYGFLYTYWNCLLGLDEKWQISYA